MNGPEINMFNAAMGQFEWVNLVVSWDNLKGVKKLIKIVLVIPIGSAEAERAFSIMNHARTKRSLLKGETISELMRIRMNGPEINMFDAAKYARKWVAQGKLRTDQASQVKQTTKNRIRFRHLHDEDILERDGTVVNGKEMTSSNLY